MVSLMVTSLKIPKRSCRVCAQNGFTLWLQNSVDWERFRVQLSR